MDIISVECRDRCEDLRGDWSQPIGSVVFNFFRETVHYLEAKTLLLPTATIIHVTSWVLLEDRQS